MDVYELSKKLESKGFKVFYTNTIAETRGLLTELIGRTDTVGAGGSATLDEIGIGEALKERGNTVYIRRLMPDVNPDEVMKKAVFADWFLTSTNALTEDGNSSTSTATATASHQCFTAAKIPFSCWASIKS